MGTEEKKELEEFIDYVFIEETDDFDKYNELIYLKCLGKDNEYLGSFWIAILTGLLKEDIKSFVEKILTTKYIMYEKYNMIHYKKL
jgi:hypothetical protein